MVDPFFFAVSVLSLCISAVTAVFTFRRGTIIMSQPTIIVFGRDVSNEPNDLPKVYLRTLLFSTSKRGRVIESMHVSLSRNETHQNFSFWVYGEERLVRGSGLYVGETGVAVNHHFMIPRDGNVYRFMPGRYRLDVFAQLLGNSKRKLLFSQALEVSQEQAALLEQPRRSLFFDWGPDASSYLAHVDYRAASTRPEDFLKFFRSLEEAEPSKD